MSGFSDEMRVSPQRPCPVCGKPDWCAFSTDGQFALCQRLAEWDGKPAFRHTAAGWLHPLDGRSPRPRVLTLSPLLRRTPDRPRADRAQTDRVYRRLADLCGLDEHAREDLIVKRRFSQALAGAAILFSLPRSGGQNEEISEALIAEFGLALAESIPGFATACHSCEGAGTKNGQVCRTCEGLGKTRPRFRSVRGGRHDYALIACDENGLAFWGMSRKLPFDDARGKNKYVLLSSSRALGASIAGLPKYHVAGRHYPRREVWITEGIVKAEVTACYMRCPVIGLAGTQPDEATIDALVGLVRGWAT